MRGREGGVMVDGGAVEPDKEGEPMISAWLSFLDRDIAANPGRLVPFAAGELAALEKLVETVVVDDDDEIPEDVTF